MRYRRKAFQNSMFVLTHFVKPVPSLKLNELDLYCQTCRSVAALGVYKVPRSTTGVGVGDSRLLYRRASILMAPSSIFL